MIERSREISFQFDGEQISGFEGESIAASLLRAGIIHLRDAPHSGTPRGMFCVMGICQECVIEIDGKKQEACRTKVRDGLSVNKVANV